MNARQLIEQLDFKPGMVLTDGDIQRYIHGLHDGFEDDHRIEGDYVLVDMPVSDIPESEWELDGELVGEYAELTTPFPPVVLDKNFSFIDGGHRHAAAMERGDGTIRAFIPVSPTK